jgi:mRNA-degrading endonuclease RelE of RelBE toxin-antitoxin system
VKRLQAIGGAALRCEIVVTPDALLDLKHLRKHEQRAVVADIEAHLPTGHTTETRNCKPLRPNDLSSWELRVGDYRVFYDVDAQARVVTIKAIGWKSHSTLYIRGKEFQL